MAIEKGIPAQIYVLTYPRPKSGYQVAQELYGHKHWRPLEIIKKLSKEGYFIPVEDEEWRHTRWISSSEPLLKRIEEIKEEDGITLNELDKLVLKNLLDNRIFRESIEKKIPINIREKNIDGIDYILTQLEIILTLKEAKEEAIITAYKEEGGHAPYVVVRTVQQYHEVIKNEKEKMRTLMEESIDEIKEKNPNVDIGREIETINDFLYFWLIPKQVYKKCKKISSFGRDYYQMRDIIKTIIDVELPLQLIREVLDKRR